MSGGLRQMWSGCGKDGDTMAGDMVQKGWASGWRENRPYSHDLPLKEWEMHEFKVHIWPGLRGAAQCWSGLWNALSYTQMVTDMASPCIFEVIKPYESCGGHQLSSMLMWGEMGESEWGPGACLTDWWEMLVADIVIINGSNCLIEFVGTTHGAALLEGLHVAVGGGMVATWGSWGHQLHKKYLKEKLAVVMFKVVAKDHKRSSTATQLLLSWSDRGNHISNLADVWWIWDYGSQGIPDSHRRQEQHLDNTLNTPSRQQE
ncbi:hypothetical protein F5146DRAFT_1007571 [Armillaria mellea]|nr:hypothetical protein F5146DRAFT_1007571 [Armillaria mellea]